MLTLQKLARFLKFFLQLASCGPRDARKKIIFEIGPIVAELALHVGFFSLY